MSRPPCTHNANPAVNILRAHCATRLIFTNLIFKLLEEIIDLPAQGLLVLWILGEFHQQPRQSVSCHADLKINKWSMDAKNASRARLRCTQQKHTRGVVASEGEDKCVAELCVGLVYFIDAAVVWGCHRCKLGTKWATDLVSSAIAESHRAPSLATDT